jgi:hypothetical protein
MSKNQDITNASIEGCGKGAVYGTLLGVGIGVSLALIVGLIVLTVIGSSSEEISTGTLGFVFWGFLGGMIAGCLIGSLSSAIHEGIKKKEEIEAEENDSFSTGVELSATVPLQYGSAVTPSNQVPIDAEYRLNIDEKKDNDTGDNHSLYPL